MEEKNLFLELLNMQQSVEEKKKMIDILRPLLFHRKKGSVTILANIIEKIL